MDVDSSKKRLDNDEIQKLAMRAGAGDETAFNILFKDLYRTIGGLCFGRLGGDGADVEEVTQNTFIKAWRRIGTYRGESGAKFRAWLYQIARNECANTVRSDRKLTGIREQQSEWMLGWTNGDVHAFSRADWQQVLCVRLEMEKLPPKEREVTAMRVIGGFTCKEIADVVGEKESTVKTWWYKCRETIKKKCDD